MKKTVSKCGARFSPKKVTELIYKNEKFNLIEMQEEKKPIQKKTTRSYTKKTPEVGVCDFVNLENENVIGVSDTNI
jgi:hypothetical protein